MERTRTAVAAMVSVILLLSAAVMIVPTSDAAGYIEESSTVDVPETVTGGEYPSKLDLRDRSLVTSVKNQGNYGTCWVHSAISCVETNLISKGYADTTIDLSELQLAYYLSHMSSDEMKGNEGDAVDTVDNFLMCGGECFTTTFIFSNWRGVVLESDAPYTSADPEMTLDPSLEYSKDRYVITDVQWMNAKDINAAKAVLNSGNSLVTNYYASDPDGYNTVTVEGERVVAYYSAADKLPNHAVTVIGYDDDFPADYFKTEPEGNGAWLIKNSWGTESSMVDDTGCFWLSYYDTTISYFESFSAVPVSEYDHNYQYDGGISQHQNKVFVSEAYMSNVFRSAQDEEIRSVSFYTYNSEADYTVYIYTSGYRGNPASGTLAGTASGHMKYAGYHTVTVDPISIAAGTTFSVVIKLNGDNIEIPIDTTVSIIDDADQILWAVSDTEAKAGQSYVSADGRTWADVSADGMSNVRIKVFTCDSEGTGDHTGFVIAISAVAMIAIASMAYFLIRRP